MATGDNSALDVVAKPIRMLTQATAGRIINDKIWRRIAMPIEHPRPMFAATALGPKELFVLHVTTGAGA